MSRFVVRDLPLKGLKIIERQFIDDSRGSLSRLFCAEELFIAGWIKPIAQINHTITIKKGTVRGMHYQLMPYSEMKIVSCIRGQVFDVVIDLRPQSSTYLMWHAEVISAENNRSLLIPEGFAHGFQALADNVELIYLHSSSYQPAFEDGINAKDSLLKIDWPLPISDRSDRDQSYPLITKSFSGISLNEL